ncbi:hypothetical protein [Pseudomonas nitroreducens]|uniref:hypothetical protein n=1 Tax=Pseudomonas nitroreducens TaxID=46680 RepID=UPI00380CD668
MEPNAKTPCPPDTRNDPNGSLPETTSGEAALSASYAFEQGESASSGPARSVPRETLSSWDGPGTAYTLAPRPVAAPPAPAPTIAPLPTAEPNLLAPAPGASANWSLIAGVIVGALTTALLLALWQPWAIDNELDVPSESAPGELSQSKLEQQGVVERSPAPADSLETATPDSMDDGSLIIPPSEPVPEEQPAPLIDVAAPDTPATPIDPVQVPVPAPAPTPTLHEAPAPQAKRPSAPVAAAEQKPHPLRTQVMTVTGSKPSSPTPPRSAPAPVATGTLSVVVQPWGEVWIDGRKRGISPPLFKLQLPPGSYRIELRNPDLPAYSQDVQISAGQSVTLRHSFQ